MQQKTKTKTKQKIKTSDKKSKESKNKDQKDIKHSRNKNKANETNVIKSRNEGLRSNMNQVIDNLPNDINDISANQYKDYVQQKYCRCIMKVRAQPHIATLSAPYAICWNSVMKKHPSVHKPKQCNYDLREFSDNELLAYAKELHQRKLNPMPKLSKRAEKGDRYRILKELDKHFHSLKVKT